MPVEGGSTWAARVRAQASQHATVKGDLVLALGGLDHLHHLPEAGIAHDAPERLGPQRAFADELMAVPAGAERRLGVVEVQAAQEPEADGLLPSAPDAVVVTHQVV